MTKEEAIKILKSMSDISTQGEAIDMAIEALQTEPTKAVQPSLADVYKWERDIALSQLEEYGIGFAEKKRDDLVKVVRCKDCKHWHSNTEFCGIWSFQNIAQRTLSDDYCSRSERREE
jgi:hypothetical protein